MDVDLNELTRNSLTAAYKDEISLLFRSLVANTAGGRKLEESAAEFIRGVALAQTAYMKAEELIP